MAIHDNYVKLRYYITKIDGKMSKKMLYFCTNISFLIFFCYILIFTHFREIFFIKWCWNRGSLYLLSLCTLNLWTATPLLISLFIFMYITFVLIPISPARSRHSLLISTHLCLPRILFNPPLSANPPCRKPISNPTFNK